MSRTAAEDLLRERLAVSPQGMLSWREVMRLALYEPGVGYYRGGGQRRIGRQGDFYTSVSVGPVFGELLACFIAKIWTALGQPESFGIIEQGAHDGTLARDLLNALAKHRTGISECAQYWIIEPFAAQRDAQLRTAGGHGAALHQVESLADLSGAPAHAVFICNELLDAFPVHRVQWENAHWQEQYVTCASGGPLSFVSGPLSVEELHAELPLVATGAVAPSQVAEVNLEMQEWLRGLAGLPFSGAVLVLDYGVTQAEWFAGDRPRGTLRRYFQHQCDENVLEQLGECDLTSHVNFTRLAREAASLGLSILEFIEQGRFLTRMAADLFASGESPPSPGWVRQFQTLTHPNHLGNPFQALVLGKGMEKLPGAGLEENIAARRRLGLVSEV